MSTTQTGGSGWWPEYGTVSTNVTRAIVCGTHTLGGHSRRGSNQHQIVESGPCVNCGKPLRKVTDIRTRETRWWEAA